MIHSAQCILLSLALCSVSAVAADTKVIKASETPRLNGRVQYAMIPGSGTESIKSLDQSLPQEEIRVGPSAQNGVGLGYLIAFETDPSQRNQLLMAGKIELVIKVLKTALGGSPVPLKVALLQSAGGAVPEHFAQFGAWNNAENLKEIGTVDGDPDIGEVRFDITELLAASPPPTTAMPTVFFAIYAPVEALVSDNEGRHVIFGGKDDEAPRLEIVD